jgi:hypothetical protein
MSYCFFITFFMTGWVNKFTIVGKIIMEVVGNAASRFQKQILHQQAKQNIDLATSVFAVLLRRPFLEVN